jgi:hexosaminidase
MNMIPLPAKIEHRPGFFQLTPETVILTDAANRWYADYLAACTNIPLQVQTLTRSQSGGWVPPGKPSISLHLDASLEAGGPEGYRLEVQPDTVKVEALTLTGIFYAIQSLRQMLMSDGRIPCTHIEDWPRFAWRGFMLDEGRHFHGKNTLRLTLDLMALQKLNILHWHLTDDQGWRIEIKKYPRLTEVGAHRPGTSRSMTGNQQDGVPHSGFYTQEDIREIVTYAAERHITIVPEIELPGHSLAALAAYPEFSCTGGPFVVATHFGIFPDIYCAGKESTFTFLQNVLDEVIGLFPSPYIHIGGDEAPKKRWKACPDCQRRMQAAGLKEEHALQVYFTNRIMAYLESKGRHAIGWNQILEPGLAEAAVIQYWLGSQKPLVNAMHLTGRKVIMSTYLDTYLDHGYELMPLSRAYHYDPLPPGAPEDCILGLEFPLWTEWVPTRARFDYQVYPRLCALAETGWTPKARKDFTNFRRRLVKFLGWLDEAKVRYAPLKEAEPGRIKRLFSFFSVLRPQTKTSD